eukprot:scaffold303960_cov67-Attheya_sp.AAC.2
MTSARDRGLYLAGHTRVNRHQQESTSSRRSRKGNPQPAGMYSRLLGRQSDSRETTHQSSCLIQVFRCEPKKK